VYETILLGFCFLFDPTNMYVQFVTQCRSFENFNFEIKFTARERSTHETKRMMSDWFSTVADERCIYIIFIYVEIKLKFKFSIIRFCYNNATD